MKKLIFALALVPAMAFAEMKIATVDLLLLIRNHPDYERNEKFMSEKSKDLQKRTEAIKSEGEALQAEGKKQMEQFRNPMLNEKSKAELEKKLQDIQQKLIQIEQRYRSELMRCNQELQDDRNRFLKTTTEDLREKLKKFSEAKGYDLVIDSNAAIFSRKDLDVTEAMLREMGVDPKKARGKFDNEGK